MTLHALAFIRRFLQHVLPSGLRKVRYDGFLPPSGSIPLEQVKARIEIAYGFALVSPEAEPLTHPHHLPLLGWDTALSRRLAALRGTRLLPHHQETCHGAIRIARRRGAPAPLPGLEYSPPPVRSATPSWGSPALPTASHSGH